MPRFRVIFEVDEDLDPYSSTEIELRLRCTSRSVIDADYEPEADERSGIHAIPEFAPARLEARQERLLAGGTR